MTARGLTWGKMEIIQFLSRLRDYRSYLEICTPTTGNEFAKIEQSRFDICHRLMYRCPASFTDGLKIDFKTSGLDISRCIEDIRDGGVRYDIILVDPWHEYEPSYRDLETALSLVADGGSIVVHDCLPPTDDIISPTSTPGPWCGVTFIAYIDLVTRKRDVKYYTVDADFGCGVIQPRNEMRVDVPATLLESWNERRGDPNAAFQFAHDNKHALLQLTSIEGFICAEALGRLTDKATTAARG